jgi:DNA-binding GntR family transcriptional regulator
VHRGATVAELTPHDIREIYHLRRMLELSAVQAAKRRSAEHLEKLRRLVDQYEGAVRAGDWTGAVASDLQFHSLLIRFHNNRRLESFYQKVLRELRMGMVLVDRGLDNPARLIRVHRSIYQLLAAGKLQQCATALAQHLDESEARISKVISDHASARNSQPELRRLAREAKAV